MSRHYNSEQWQKYINRSYTKKVREKMERHLYRCDKCQDVYLSQCYAMNQFDMPEYITYDVIKYLESMEYTTKIQIRKKRRIFELSMYYIAAACVTYLLIFNGFFNFLDKKASDVANNMTKNMSELSLNIPELNISAFNKILIKFNERVIEE